MVELVAAKAVRVDVAMVVLAAAVDQDQRIVGPHAADADRALAGLVRRLADVDALNVAHRVDQRHIGALAQFIGGHHGDAGGRVGDLLFKARGGDDDIRSCGCFVAGVCCGGRCDQRGDGYETGAAAETGGRAMEFGHGCCPDNANDLQKLGAQLMPTRVRVNCEVEPDRRQQHFDTNGLSKRLRSDDVEAVRLRILRAAARD